MSTNINFVLVVEAGEKNCDSVQNPAVIPRDAEEKRPAVRYSSKKFYVIFVQKYLEDHVDYKSNVENARNIPISFVGGPDTTDRVLGTIIALGLDSFVVEGEIEWKPLNKENFLNLYNLMSKYRHLQKMYPLLFTKSRASIEVIKSSTSVFIGTPADPEQEESLVKHIFNEACLTIHFAPSM